MKTRPLRRKHFHRKLKRCCNRISFCYVFCESMFCMWNKCWFVFAAPPPAYAMSWFLFSRQRWTLFVFMWFLAVAYSLQLLFLIHAPHRTFSINGYCFCERNLFPSNNNICSCFCNRLRSENSFPKKSFFLFLHWNLLEGWGKFTRNRWTDTQKYEMIQINGHILCVKTETKSDDIETFCLFHDNASYLCLRESSDSISLFLFNHMRRIAPHKNFHFVLAIGTDFFCISVWSISDFVWFQFHSAFLFFCWTCFVAIDESFLRVQICNKVERTQLLFRSINVGICKKNGYFCEQMKWIYIFFLYSFDVFSV